MNVQWISLGFEKTQWKWSRLRLEQRAFLHSKTKLNNWHNVTRCPPFQETTKMTLCLSLKLFPLVGLFKYCYSLMWSDFFAGLKFREFLAVAKSGSASPPKRSNKLKLELRNTVYNFYDKPLLRFTVVKCQYQYPVQLLLFKKIYIPNKKYF